MNTLQVLIDLISSNWNSANTDSVTPDFSVVYDKKRVGGLTDSVTWISDYFSGPENREALDLGYNFFTKTEFVTFDIRTSKSYSHSLNCRDEIERILLANRKSITGFDYLLIVRIKDLSDSQRKLWRWIFDVELK